MLYNVNILILGVPLPKKVGSGCTFPLPDEKSGELHCHPSRKRS